MDKGSGVKLHYKGCPVHRVVRNFVMQGGDIVKGNGSGGANNFPLKGGKMSNWEGGIRGNAFASGGWLPPAVRGSRFDGRSCGDGSRRGDDVSAAERPVSLRMQAFVTVKDLSFVRLPS